MMPILSVPHLASMVLVASHAASHGSSSYVMPWEMLGCTFIFVLIVFYVFEYRKSYQYNKVSKLAQQEKNKIIGIMSSSDYNKSVSEWQKEIGELKHEQPQIQNNNA